MASFYSGIVRGKNGYDIRIRMDVTYARKAGSDTAYNVTVSSWIECTNKTSCPFYNYSIWHYGQTNDFSNVLWNESAVIPNASWSRSVKCKEGTATVDPGGPAKTITSSISMDIPAGTYTFSSKQHFECSGAVTLPATWVAPDISVHTASTNNTTGSSLWAGWLGWGTNSWSLHSGDPKSYAGDSFTFNWQIANRSDGINTSPDTRLALIRKNGSGHTIEQDNAGAMLKLMREWGSTASYDQYYNYTPTVHDCGNYIIAVMRQDWNPSSGDRLHRQMGRGHYIQPVPTLTSNVNIRSRRFYTGTPSCMVARLTTYNWVSNGYGGLGSNYNDSGLKTTNAVTNNVIHIPLSTAGDGTIGEILYGNKNFNANYSLPESPIDLHTQKFTPSTSARNCTSFMYTNWFNPNTGARDRLGFLKSPDTAISIKSGSITLPTIDKIEPVSGDGTTVVVPESKRIYTNKDNVTIIWKVTNSGNKNGFGYDVRINENSGTMSSASATSHGASMVPVKVNVWKSPYGGIDITSNTVSLRHDSTVTGNGDNRSILVLPYVRDGEGYQVFGEATRSYVTSPSWNFRKITVPAVPILNKWSNTLPAIDGVKDRVQWEATSPSNWGNVIDFTTGFKLAYKIGKDTARANGWQWYFTDSPTDTSKKFSGHFDQTYDRSTFTESTAVICATNKYDATWDANPAFQSDFSWSTQKSYAITAKTPYSETVGTLTMRPTTRNNTTLLTEVPFIFKCPTQNSMNGTDLIITTKMIIDGGSPVTITDPTYTLGTANTLTGLRKVTFNNLNETTTTLTRGAHTLKVQSEILTYFKSTTPVTNNVYLGATTVESNVMNIEVAELPSKPTIKTPNPKYFKAGAIKNLKLEWTANDWGCLDTQNNNRHFDLELIAPDGHCIARTTHGRNETGTSSGQFQNIIFMSPKDEGTYTWRLRQVTVVGASDWAEMTFDVQPAEEPENSEIKANDILALPSWNWNLKINPGSNGSYDPYKVNTMTKATGYFSTTLHKNADNNPNHVRSIRANFNVTGRSLPNKTTTVTYSICGDAGLGNPNNYSSYSAAYKPILRNTIWKKDTTTLYTQSGDISLDYHTEPKSGTFTIAQNNKGVGSFSSSITANIGGTNVSGSASFNTPLIPATETQARYKVEVVRPTKAYKVIGTKSYQTTTTKYDDLGTSTFVAQDEKTDLINTHTFTAVDEHYEDVETVNFTANAAQDKLLNTMSFEADQLLATTLDWTDATPWTEIDGADLATEMCLQYKWDADTRNYSGRIGRRCTAGGTKYWTYRWDAYIQVGHVTSSGRIKEVTPSSQNLAGVEYYLAKDSNMPLEDHEASIGIQGNSTTNGIKAMEIGPTDIHVGKAGATMSANYSQYESPTTWFDWGEGGAKTQSGVHTYTTPGTYTVKTYKRLPASMSVDLTDKAGSDIWFDYGDGSALTQSGTHTYTSADTYEIRIKRKIPGNMSVSYSEILVSTITYDWGDGSTSISGKHTYTTPGTYTINVYQKTLAQKTVDKSSEMGSDIWFDYGDGSALTQSGTHTYVDAGTYTITKKRKWNDVKKTVDITQFNLPTWLAKDVEYDYGDGTGKTTDKTHVYKNEGTYTITASSYTWTYPVVKTVLGWTNINNGVRVDRNFTTDLNGYEDGSYRMLITYERNFTTKMVQETKLFEIIPPAVEIADYSYVVLNEVGPETFPFMINIMVFATTLSWKCEYSLDYGKTWINIPLTQHLNAEKWFRVKLPLSYLDVVQVRASGSNPVNEETDSFSHEMPTSYKIWLSYADRVKFGTYLDTPELLKTYTLGNHTPSGSEAYKGTLEQKYNRLLYTSNENTAEIRRGPFIGNISNHMVDGKRYRISFKARGERNRTIERVCFESASTVKTIDISNKYQQFYIEGTHRASSAIKSLAFYSKEWNPRERFYVKDIRVSEIKTIRDNDFTRRVMMSHNGGELKKIKHVSKK